MLSMLCTAVFILTTTSISVEEKIDPADYLYPGDEVLQLLVQLDDHTLDSCIVTAVDTLESLGGSDILICRIRKIEAPLEGYLLDGLWQCDLDGQSYNTFRIGVGVSVDSGVFALIARGEDQQGIVQWYPPPGPDYYTAPDSVFPEELLQYEFLIDRDSFEGLDRTFTRP